MQIRKRRAFKKFEPEKKRTRINEFIKVPEVFVIGEKGEQFGVMKTEEALAKAQEAEADLVEVNPTGKPPVCKIMNFGKIKYEKEKAAHKQKLANKKGETKGIRLTFKIKGGDLETRIKQAQKFIKGGNSVKIDMILKGREKAHAGNAREVIENFIASVNVDDSVKVMQAVQKQGGRFSAIISPKS